MTKNQKGLLACGSFLVGMIIGGWGWDKNTSTIAERTHGAVPMMVIGGALIVIGLGLIFTWNGWKRNRE